jgi:hypothetical protein
MSYLVGKDRVDLRGRSPGDHVTWKDGHGVAHTCLVLAAQTPMSGPPMLRLGLPCRDWVVWNTVEPLRRGRL